ncbi:hypothetical protein E3A20_07850 [Planctomyces bekefii]|uniref:Type II secretion system protein GspF domain-containing protein n=1 Tax=Planctomyces bekefii TaxID=1653850 RepID=A0A5C6M5Q5_9PLAN|nr:hypothetical protein E3A20_07850 [Planctomyces bekefii]
MDGVLWGMLIGGVLLAAARLAWLMLRPSDSVVQPAPDSLEVLLMPEEVSGLEGALVRFFVESELPWTPRGCVLWLTVITALLYLLAVLAGLQDGWFLFLHLILGVIFVTFLVLRRNGRLNEFRMQLPDVVSLLARSSRAGLEFSEALGLCEKMARGRLQGELQHCRNQLLLGRTVSGTMESLARRAQLRELGLLAAVLSVHRQTGGALADSLDRLSQLLRDRIAFRRQMQAASSGGRLSALLIAPAAPLLFAALLLINPEHVQVFFTEAIGRTFLVLGVMLNAIGIVWILGLIKMPR